MEEFIVLVLVGALSLLELLMAPLTAIGSLAGWAL